jgi:hypothetical protein
MMALIFRGIFFGKDIVLIYDDLFLADYIINFFNYVKNSLFEQNIIVMSKSDYKENWAEYTHHLVLEKAVILQNDNPLIDPKKMGIEKGIVKKFRQEDDLVTGLIILRNEIKKAHEFSKIIAQFLDRSTTKTWNPKMLIEHIKEVYSEKIQKSYLTFLLAIVEYYFKVQIPPVEKSKFLDFL